jgi:hypothetical protein
MDREESHAPPSQTEEQNNGNQTEVRLYFSPH